MKEIRYRGGMLIFNLPESWKEEYYRDGGAAFYEGKAEHGSLNVSLTTVETCSMSKSGGSLSRGWRLKKSKP